MTDKVLVVLLSGKSQNGKDSLYIESGKDLDFYRVSFADKLKKSAMDIFRLTEDQVFGDLKDVEDKRYPNLVDEEYITKEYPPTSQTSASTVVRIENKDYKEYFTPRRILQLYGFKMRELYPTIWADYVFKSIIPNKISEGVTKFMITDVRFKNEIKAAESWSKESENYNIVKIRINRDGFFSLSAPDDISEVDLDDYNDWDSIILNNKDLKSLGFKAKTTLEYYLEKYGH